MRVSPLPVISPAIVLLLVVGCSAAPDEPPEPPAEPAEVDVDEVPDEPEPDAAEEKDEPPEPEAPTLDPSRFSLATVCTDEGLEAPRQVEVVDGVVELPDDELRSVLNVEVVGELDDGRMILFLDCWQTGANFNTATSVEAVVIQDDASLEQVEVVGPEAGRVSDVELEADEIVITLERPDLEVLGVSQLQAVRATDDGTGWTVTDDGPPRKAFDGPGVRIVVDGDSPWSWDDLDGCTGTLNAPSSDSWTVVYVSGLNDPAALDRLASAEGGRSLEPLPRGASVGTRATGEGFDAVGQPALRDEVMVGDEAGRLRWLVAIDGPADHVMDEILAGLELTVSSDAVFTQTEQCEPDDDVG